MDGSYDPSHGSTSRKIVSSVLFAYDNPKDGTCTLLLIVHQGFHVPTMNNSLIPLYQMGENDIVVYECPKPQLITHAQGDDKRYSSQTAN
jgi:hypothetical protein